jgi:hypothetical protein
MSFEGVTDRTKMDPKVLCPVFQTGFRIVPHVLPQRLWVKLSAALGDDCPDSIRALSPTVNSGRTDLKKFSRCLHRMSLLEPGDHPLTKV